MALISEQTSSLKKKITSLITAGALIITGSAGIAHLSRKKDDKSVDISTTTSVSTTVSDSKVVEDELFRQLKLTADFNINDKAAVKKRAKAIYELSEKEISVGTIVNLIYLINGKYKRINFSGKEFGAKDLQNLFVSLTRLLDDNMTALEKKQIGENWKPNYNGTIYAYMFMAKTQADTNKYVVTKQEAIEAAKIVKEQLNNIRDGKADNYSKTALKHYKLYMSLKNRTGKDKNAKILAGYPYVFFRDYTCKNVIMTAYLSKEEQQDKIDENYTETYAGKLTGFVEEAFNISLQKEIQEAIASGQFGYDVPNFGSSYNSSDAKNADSQIDATRVSTRDVIDSGGREVTSYSERVNTPTTSVVRESHTATPTTNVVEESYVAEPITEGTTKEVTTTKKAETTTKKEESTKSNTTTTAPTTKKNEEVVDEGGEVVFEGSEDELEEFLKGQRYVDADTVKTNSYVKTK